MQCASNEFQCRGDVTQCVHESWRCDGSVDCDDESDELGCPEQRCGEHHFACSTGDECIHEAWLCDADVDCPDGSDELNCKQHSMLISYRLATHLENLEKSGNLRVVTEKSGKIGKVRENVFLHVVYYHEYCS